MKILALILTSFLTILLVGCASPISSEKEQVIVFAAASLTEVMEDLAIAFEEENPDVEIIFNFAGSQVLTSQIEEGAMADMFFSANERYIVQLKGEDAGETFASNQLVLLHSSDLDLASFNQTIMLLGEGDYRPVVLALEDVPVGRYTKLMMDAYLEASGDQIGYEAFYDQVVSYESDVKAVVAKVRIHEGDMGIVYRTDAQAVDLEANNLKWLDIEEAYNQTAIYRGILLRDQGVSGDFYDFVVEGDGQEILRNAGF